MPSSSNLFFKSWKFSIMPFWTTAIFPELSMWGCAFLTSGFPWVAHLVWPIPTVPGIFSSLRLSIKFLSFPSALLQVIEFVSEFIIAIPAES